MQQQKMFEEIITTPSVLKWARKTSGYTENEVIERLNEKRVSISTFQQWELGKEQPSYSQLKKLAKFYKRPIAVFFFPQPPQEESPQEKLRAVPESYTKSLTPKMIQLVKKAQIRQINLYEMYGDLLPSDFQNFTSSIGNINPSGIKALAAQVREALGVSLEEQFQWKDIDQAFKEWRRKLENIGIWVFKEAFKEKNYSGFCLYDENLPIIYISTNAGKDKVTERSGKIAQQRQIFTLFHELGHLLICKGGIDFRDNVETEFTGRYRQEEVFCNAFAGEFLVPDESIGISDIPSDAEISNYAKQYGVSREVILRKYLNKNLVTQSFYDEKKKMWEQQWKDDENRKKEARNKDIKISPHAIHKANLGDKYLTIVFQEYYRQRISENQLADYLEIKVGSIPRIEGYISTGSS